MQLLSYGKDSIQQLPRQFDVTSQTARRFDFLASTNTRVRDSSFSLCSFAIQQPRMLRTLACSLLDLYNSNFSINRH